MKRSCSPMLVLILFITAGGCVNTAPPPNPFRRPVSYPIGKSPSHLIASDLTQDGLLDLVSVNTEDNSLSILIGKNDASFPDTLTRKVGKAPRWVVAGDFNEDKKTDLAVVQNSEDTVQILINKGGALFEDGPLYKVNRSPYSATAADFNGDGHLDMALVSRFDRLLVLSGKGDGTFEKGMTASPGTIPTGIIAGEFNGDSFVDLAIANNGGHKNSNIIFFWGKGDGTFKKGENGYRTGLNPIALIAEDFNQDSHPDVLVMNGLGDALSLFMGEQGEKFSKVRDFGAEGGPVSAAPADYNGDKIIDLVVANSRSGNISYMPGKGKGKFRHPPLNIPTGAAPFFVLTKDFNADGKMDLAVINNEDATLSILIGKVR
ncbi:MAG: FG-GAP repeat domain-containing protein [Nitrospiria bacterium]